jgi:hypothetical protein
MNDEYSSAGQSGYTYTAPGYSAVPSYTQADVDAYYYKYHCYPPQPYNVIPSYYVPPVQHVATAGYQTASGYHADPGRLPELGRLALPGDEEMHQHRRSPGADQRSRSNSRTR